MSIVPYEFLRKHWKFECFLIVFSAFILLPSSVGAQQLEDMFRAALEGDLATIKRGLDRGLDADSTDPDGNSLLMLAARAPHKPVVELLLARKASVTRRNKFGDTPLLVAAVSGDTQVAGWLLERGAPLGGEGWLPLHYAAFAGKAEMAKFLIAKGADKNALAPNGFTALMLAARGGHVEAARVILFEDPDVNHRTESGDTALKIALQKDLKAVADLLRRAGAVE